MARFLDLERDEVGRRFLRRVGDGLSLIDNDRQECIFWEKGCTIYPVRPTQCRTFPFWRENLESPAAWDAVESVCPGAGSGRVYDLVQIGNLQSGQAETRADN